MKNALIIGGTGLTGKKLTRLLLADKRYKSLKLLVRKPMDIIYEKLEQIPFNFDKPDDSKVQADEVFCCIGTTIAAAGSKEAFYRVDYEYVLMLANIAYKNGCKKFALISSMGANKNSAVFYNKTKGQIEEAIKAIGFENCFIFRPSILLGTRNQSRFGESVAKSLLTKLSFLLPKKYRPIQSKSVAIAMQFVMNSNYNGFKVFESDEIAAIANSPH
jgi:uncharacterized protein YbjT (DUF2867 family)